MCVRTYIYIYIYICPHEHPAHPLCAVRVWRFGGLDPSQPLCLRGEVRKYNIHKLIRH